MSISSLSEDVALAPLSLGRVVVLASAISRSKFRSSGRALGEPPA